MFLNLPTLAIIEIIRLTAKNGNVYGFDFTG